MSDSGGVRVYGHHLTRESVVVAGYGEIGQPIAELLRGAYQDAHVVDPDQLLEASPSWSVTSLHICFPYTAAFVDNVVGYIDRFRPDVVLIHATIVPGTTERIIKRHGWNRVAYTMSHGVHHGGRMKAQMLEYPKFIGCRLDDHLHTTVRNVLERMGHPRHLIRWLPIHVAEYTKLLATSYYGMLIAYMQEVERILPADWEEARAAVQEVEGWLQIGEIFPGRIGGHCVMPNLEILQHATRDVSGGLWEAIIRSNELKEQEG